MTGAGYSNMRMVGRKHIGENGGLKTLTGENGGQKTLTGESSGLKTLAGENGKTNK